MYLARIQVRNQFHFVIRESYSDGECFRSRDLFDLGDAPQQCICYSGSRVFYVNDWVISGLQKNGFDPDPFELEEIFFPFVDPEVRYRLDSIGDRTRHRNWKQTSSKMRREILDATHEFDKRRIHFLRFGQTDQRRMNRSAVLFKVLLNKSRDELEQYFLMQEQVLTPAEYKRYMFTIFDLQKFFTESYAVTMPEALSGEELDKCFVKQVCRLDRDRSFWEGLVREERLPEYLVRYVIMYFDFAFPGTMGWRDYINDFMNSRRHFSPPGSGKKVTLSQAATVFGISRSELSELTATELKRLFRKKAREIHPDQGGDHDRFIELANVYKDMLRTKAGTP